VVLVLVAGVVDGVDTNTTQNPNLFLLLEKIDREESNGSEGDSNFRSKVVYRRDHHHQHYFTFFSSFQNYYINDNHHIILLDFLFFNIKIYDFCTTM